MAAFGVQPALGEPAVDAQVERRESVGQALTRILLDVVERPGLFRTAPEGVCREPMSREPVPDQVIATFHEAVDAEWRRASPSAGPQSVMLEICLGDDGRSLGQPYLVEPAGDLGGQGAAMLLKAMRALEKAAPVSSSPGDARRWRRILVLFAPVKGEAQTTAGGGRGEAADRPGR